jgi:CheY-like chemotaxis protein
MGTFDGLRWDISQDKTPFTSARDRFYEGAAAGATALIVEDDSSNVFALSALLERGGVTVVTADSGPDALDILEHRADIGIVLMDILMPVMDGYETIAAIRSRPQSAELPIIAITCKDGSERERCIAAGASDYIPKPIDTAALLTAISFWLMGATTPSPEV